MSKDEYLITDAPLKALTVFAMPMILGSFFQQVYNMADSIIVGQFVGSSALAAVGACAALTNVFICIALGAGVGAGVLVSRYFGARDYSKMKTIVSTSLISFLILSILLGVFGFCFSRSMMSLLQTPADILDEAVLYLRVYFVGFPFLFMYNILSTMFTSIGESKIPLGLLIFSSVLNIFMDLWMVAGLGLGVFGAALATLIAQGISAVFSLLIFFSRMRRYKSHFVWFNGQELYSMLQIAVPSILQQSTVSIGMMIVQAVVNPFGTQALAGYSATMRVENVFSLIFVSIGNAVSPYVSQNLGAKKPQRIKKGYHAALVLDLCFAVLAFIIIETLHTQISSLFLGKDGTALAYQVSGDYMRWIGYFFIFMGIKMATDGVLRGLGIMRPFLIANMVNLAIRLSVALFCAPRFGISFVWLAVPAGWFANFLISYVALRKTVDIQSSMLVDELDIEEKDVLRAINEYTDALTLLDQYDHQVLRKPEGSTPIYRITYEDCVQMVGQMKDSFETDVFGVEKESGKVEGIIAAVYQSVFGQDAYPSLEEKAANLLYFMIKDHPYADGCKRIAASLFLEFLDKNNALFQDGRKRLSDGTLVAITLMVAESKAEEKDVMVKLIMNLLKLN